MEDKNVTWGDLQKIMEQMAEEFRKQGMIKKKAEEKAAKLFYEALHEEITKEINSEILATMVKTIKEDDELRTNPKYGFITANRNLQG